MRGEKEFGKRDQKINTMQNSEKCLCICPYQGYTTKSELAVCTDVGREGREETSKSRQEQKTDKIRKQTSKQTNMADG